MGGSGGGWGYWPPINLAPRIASVGEQAEAARFESEVSDLLRDYLQNFNNRDTASVRDRLDEVKELIADDIADTIDQNFGGSVAKHTYVDGLSDIDTLVILNGTELASSPQKARERVSAILAERLGPGCDVSVGRLAVTVKYSDGMEIQLLPAIKKDDGGLKIQSARRQDRWSHVNPRGFQQALTKRNQECSGKLVPTIKLVKAINGALPEAKQLSGYHIESLAIAAFRNYQGPRNTSAMMREFFSKAPDLVKQPIKDSTGQSVHVDDYLGPASSARRLAASQTLSRIERRIQTATAARDLDGWRDLFEGTE